MSMLKAIKCWGKTFTSVTELSKDTRCKVHYSLLWGRLKRGQIPEIATTQELGPTSKHKFYTSETNDTQYCKGPCGELKLLSEFTKDKSGRKGCRAQCKACVLKSRQKSPKYKIIQRNSNLKKYKNFSAERYQEFFTQQKGLCAACGETPSTGYNNRLYVDHNHITGEVDGLICSRCNVAAGMLDDSSSKAIKLATYLHKHSR